MEGATALTISKAVETIGTLVSNAVSIITGNEILFVSFCIALVGAGFGLVARAKSVAM